jgi:hypothetical protein
MPTQGIVQPIVQSSGVHVAQIYNFIDIYELAGDVVEDNEDEEE